MLVLGAHRSTALFNATRKQYGLSTHLLTLTLAPPVAPKLIAPFPTQLPPLPDATSPDTETETDTNLTDLINLNPNPHPNSNSNSNTGSGGSAEVCELALAEPDLAAVARFVKEMTNAGLVTWMERCVAEWNESVSPFSHSRIRIRIRICICICVCVCVCICIASR